jgi:catechol 2,3-dioxygenase-like lactoylglutathione lyase family enzyme
MTAVRPGDILVQRIEVLFSGLGCTHHHRVADWQAGRFLHRPIASRLTLDYAMNSTVLTAGSPRRITCSETEEVGMLRDANAVAMLAVKNLREAAKFYEETLGLSRADAEDDEVVVFESGDTMINVYRSDHAGTNQATAITWTVRDIEDVVRTLKGKGVKFEHYDLPDTKRAGDVHVSGDMKVAWFKDPDGNILSIANR